MPWSLILEIALILIVIFVIYRSVDFKNYFNQEVELLETATREVVDAVRNKLAI